MGPGPRDGPPRAKDAASEERPDERPFDLNADSRRVALLLHGFTGTPFEMRGLGEALAARGLRAVGPRLPGHGATEEVLAGTDFRDWISGLDALIARLRPEADRLALVGLSLGGLLALEQARRTRDLAALVCLAVPLWLPRATMVGIQAASAMVTRLPKLFGSDIRDRRAKRGFPSLDGFPLKPLRSLIELQARVRPHLPQVTAPTLVVHAELDHVAPVACASELYAKVGTQDKRLVRLTESYHVITVDVERERVAREVGDFLVERM